MVVQDEDEACLDMPGLAWRPDDCRERPYCLAEADEFIILAGMMKKDVGAKKGLGWAATGDLSKDRERKSRESGTMFRY